ncbi:MAG: oxidoreductase [Aliiglaciecola sp.]|uniref:oxidoreductase n=1 Tax=Aliiglaciecola sp. M165 TaxID=2593649 RepID=UPI00117CA247|nr:oxidoreductase [Aliiglaciecola sp. M165]TRY30953.1 SDR family oxidoreductase [Aliiglaciecola sp. M165]
MLKGKTILVLGAAGKIGSEVVRGALKEGASVVAADVNQLKMKSDFELELIASGGKLTLKTIDVLCEKSTHAIFNGSIHFDGLVNCTYPRNAAYGASFLDVKLSDFNQNLKMHLGSAFLIMQQAARYFESSKKPISIINFSSIYGFIAPRFELYRGTSMTMPVEYAAIKSAIVHLTKYVSSYVKHSDFRVNCVSPGGIIEGQPDSFLEAYKKQAASKGMLDREDVVGSVLFLLSDHSRYVRGQNIVVDDGFSL